MKKDDLGYIKEKRKNGNIALVLVLVAALGIGGGLAAVKATEGMETEAAFFTSLSR